MGICYGTPVGNHSHSPSNTTSTSPESTKNDNKPPNELEAKAGRGSSSGTPDAEAKLIKDDNIAPTGRIVTPNMKMFALSELRAATKNFRPDTVLGEGGFGRVFKGWLDEKTYAPSKVGAGIAVAVKKSNPDSVQGLEEWQAEVKFLGKFSHPNLVKLLGYCWEDKQFLLVYEYMQKGSLENHLFRKGAEPLPWHTRLKIAIDAAKGLSFLHSSEKSVIYRDFKASNILLDGAYNAKLSDFGLAKFGPINGNSHVTTRVMGTYGYAAPEYVATGHLYVKSDVYGFGVVLLEMLTGLRALDTNRPSGEHNLVEYTKPYLSDRRKVKKIMDPRLEDQYPKKAVIQAAELILKCLESDPKSRPSMDQILQTLENISAIQEDAKKSKPKAKAKAKQHTLKHQGESSSQPHPLTHHRSPRPSSFEGHETRGRASYHPTNSKVRTL